MNAIFEVELDQKDTRCTNTKVKCVCHRFLRSQSYRAVALALGIRGHNHQITWAPAVKAFIRGAYPVGDGVPAGIDVPAMEPDEIRAWETEPNPTEEQIEEIDATALRPLAFYIGATGLVPEGWEVVLIARPSLLRKPLKDLRRIYAVAVAGAVAKASKQAE